MLAKSLTYTTKADSFKIFLNSLKSHLPLLFHYSYKNLLQSLQSQFKKKADLASLDISKEKKKVARIQRESTPRKIDFLIYLKLFIKFIV